eukprot:TRINITY_DN14238_c0_g1_i1.p1 TRINITY_DN14238_c0_g1~~TRINITY_DN14238_c0_g1_i1.p1  ORF type:complete len:2889 (-),score=719.16 TRINITY_DN14238_c0_g1_i1:210-8876(-)
MLFPRHHGPAPQRCGCRVGRGCGDVGRSRSLMTSLVIAVLSALPLIAGQSAFTINSIEHRPTYRPDPNKTGVDEDGNPFMIASPPTDVRQHRLSNTGDDPETDSSVVMSKFQHIGCFQAPLEITKATSTGSNMDPNECQEVCMTEVFPNYTRYDVIVAVYAERCGCELRKDVTTFREAEARNCVEYCKYYRNPICGGPPDYWGVFMEYDFQSLSAQGAYDPGRKLWYTVVAIRELSIIGGYTIPNMEETPPERFFLNVVDTYSGLAQFPYQIQLPGVVYGLQYDIDSSRLVGLLTLQSTGRLRDDVDWQYKLITITINTTFSDRPYILPELRPIFISVPESKIWMAFSGASAILSKTVNIFVFTQVDSASMKNEMKDRVYFVRIPDGFIVYEESVDFKIEQLFSNEKFGDVSALGPRYEIGNTIGGAQSYVYLARVFYSELEETVMVDWRFNPVNPIKLASTEAIGDFQIYPGVSTSEHLYNKSAIVYRFTPPQDISKGAITIYEVNIRTGQAQHWCNQTTFTMTTTIGPGTQNIIGAEEEIMPSSCQGTIWWETPYAGVYNREPGIPLALKSPSLQMARFTLDAATLIVEFDRPTLKGALQVDQDGDTLPDYVNRSTEHTGQFDCAKLFKDDTVLLLGPYPDTSCLWTTARRVQISLPRVLNITVGDSVFVRADTIYTEPIDGEYSLAATGGVQVDMPDPLEGPVVTVLGTTNIDACQDVDLSVSSSYNLGKWQEANWYLAPPTEDEPNPKDLTNTLGREYSATKLQELQDILQEASDNESFHLKMSSSLLEPASTYALILSVTSRWKLTTNKTLRITKLAFSAPSVSIDGAAVIYKKRTERVSLLATGRKSQCADAESKLAYRWYETSGKLNFDDYPEVITRADTLVVQPFILEPNILSAEPSYNEYNFSVDCYVDTLTGNTAEKTATATVSVRIERSPIYVVFTTESRMMTRGDIIILDARLTQDPDYPTPVGQTFRGVFDWWCLDPSREACFGGDASGRLGQGDAYSITTCRQDPGRKITEGGATFFAPLFDDEEYCRYARGVLMFRTEEFATGEYKFTVRATANDASLRSAQQDIFIAVTEVDVPQVQLDILNRQERYPVTKQIQIVGTLVGDSNVSRTYSWEVLINLTNPEYNHDLAAEMLNDPENTYTVDKYTYVKADETKYDLNDPEKFLALATSPNLVIKANTLDPSTQYQFRLNIDVGVAVGYNSISLRTAGLPPRSGYLVCRPPNATADTPREFEAIDWFADESPLSYHFGYLTSYGGTGQAVKMFFTTDAMPVRSLKRNTIPLGALPDYSLIIFADIATPYGATTTTELVIYSQPPENMTAAIIDGVNRVDEADGGSLMSTITDVLSLDPQNEELQNAMLDKMQEANEQDVVPVTPSQLTQQAQILNNLVENCNTGEGVMDVLETLTATAANSQSFTAEEDQPGSDLPGLMFNALGGMLPRDPSDDICAGGDSAGGQSVIMQRYRVPSSTAKSGFVYDVTAQMESVSHSQVESFTTRLASNHPQAKDDSGVVHYCPNAFCDLPKLVCIPKDIVNTKVTKVFVCCDMPNPKTVCNDPPCWVKGISCPYRAVPPSQTAPSTPAWTPSMSRGHASHQRRLPSVAARRALPQLSKQQRQGDKKPLHPFAEEEHEKHALPLRKEDLREASDYDRTKAIHTWDPNVPYADGRRLEWFKKNGSQTEGELTVLLEMEETTLVDRAKALQKSNFEDTEDETLAASYEIMAFNTMSEKMANKLRTAAKVADAKEQEELELDERDKSQRITRVNVMRDTITKQLMGQLPKDLRILVFPSSTYTMYIGKTTNLANVHSSFIFPKAFQLPGDSAGGWGWAYIEYKTNIYYWAKSNPPSPQNMLITLNVMQQNGLDLDERTTPDPINVFADMPLFANTLCLYWDRFVPNTPGGGWSSQGVINNGTGCITSHLTDIAIFIDGSVHSGTTVIDIQAKWDREIWETSCIGCGEENFVVVAVLGMILFVNLLFIMLGFVVDGSKRAEMIKKKQHSHYHFDGDGINSKRNLDDPIPYGYTSNPVTLCLGTLMNVTKREHAVISIFFYNENFTRAQRLQCLTALLSGLLALNAAVHSHPGYYQEAREWIISGCLSGFLIFPIYCGLILMFNMRPRPVKKRLIKRATNTKEIDNLREQREALARQTMMMPRPGQGGAMPGLGQHQPGATTALSLPAPLPLPPLPNNVVGGTWGATGAAALPPLPTAGGFDIAPGLTGLGGQLALPALPGMTANMPLPPPPRYPPPPKNALTAPPTVKLPPLTFPKTGPPPAPFPLPLLLNADGTVGGTMTGSLGNFDPTQPRAPPPLTADTGATPLQLQDHMGRGDMEATSLPPNMVVADKPHGMAPAMSGENTPPGPPPGMMPTASAPPGSLSPAGSQPATPTRGATPTGGGFTPPPNLPGAGIGGFSPAHSARSGLTPGLSGRASNIRTPPDRSLVMQGDGPMPLFIRPQPPSELPAPFAPAPVGPSGIATWKVPGLPPTGMMPPIPSAMGPTPGGIPMPPLVPPPPPPPPNEEDQAFVRRIKMTYFERVALDHKKWDLLEDAEETSTRTPGWVYDTMTVMPYLACCTFTLASIFIVLQYGMKFVQWQEEHWLKGSLLGLLVVLLLLELFRILMMTLVELRKFENRKKSAAGAFLPRRIGNDDDRGRQIAPPPRLMKRATAKPAVPKILNPPKERLPKPPPNVGPGGPPVIRPDPPPKMPFRPPSFSAAAMSAAFAEPPGPGAPPPKPPGLNLGGVGGGSRGATPPASGRLGQTGGQTPPGSGRLGMSGTGFSMGSTTPPGPDGRPPRPRSGTGDLQSLNQSLTSAVKAKSGEHQAPPPPKAGPGSRPGSAGSRGGMPPPPPPPADRPNYSRPSSAASGASNKAKAAAFAKRGVR